MIRSLLSSFDGFTVCGDDGAAEGAYEHVLAAAGEQQTRGSCVARALVRKVGFTSVWLGWCRWRLRRSPDCCAPDRQA